MQPVDSPELVAGLRPPEIADIVTAQISLPAYLTPPLDREPSAGAAYESNEAVWADVLQRKLRVAGSVTLTSFQLSEWMPLSAGTFHTEYGRSQRQIARERLLYDGRTVKPELKRLVPGIDPRSLGATRIYSSLGKGGMVAGGVGSVRLRPRRLDVGDAWFLSATSSTTPHEGFVVALPAALYEEHADELAQKGRVRCTLKGALRFVDSEFRARYGQGVPQLYLLAESVKRVVRSGERLRVSVPVSFQGADGSVNAAYNNFWPDEPGSLERAVRWLDEMYVKRIYDGKVVTDFDEQISWFPGADFGLADVMGGTLDPNAAGAAADRLGLGDHMNRAIVVHLQGTLVAERIETVHQDRVINVQNSTINAPLVIAEEIQGSFNTIERLPPEQAELRAQLAELAKAVAAAAREAPEEDAKTLGSDLQTLTDELARDEPRQRWYELSLESLGETARKLGVIGMPILEIATKVAALI